MNTNKSYTSLIHLASSTQVHSDGHAAASSSVRLTADWYIAKQFKSYGEQQAVLELVREVHKLDAHECFTGVMIFQGGWTLYVQDVETYCGQDHKYSKQWELELGGTL